MSSKRRDPDYCSDMLESMQRIIAYTGGISYEQFMEDRRTQDAVVRNIEVIGEAVKRLSSSLKKQHTTPAGLESTLSLSNGHRAGLCAPGAFWFCGGSGEGRKEN